MLEMIPCNESLLDNPFKIILQIFLILILKSKQQFRFKRNQKRFVIQDLIHLMEQISVVYFLTSNFNQTDQLMIQFTILKIDKTNLIKFRLIFFIKSFYKFSIFIIFLLIFNFKSIITFSLPKPFSCLKAHLSAM